MTKAEKQKRGREIALYRFIRFAKVRNDQETIRYARLELHELETSKLQTTNLKIWE